MAAQPSNSCNCQSRACPRRIHSATGLTLGAGIVIHFVINSLGWWPARYQQAVSLIYRLSPALPWASASLIFIPLAIHIVMGVNFLWKKGLRFGVESPHHGSDTRYWLQRASALVLLAFIAFHVVTLQHWGLGLFDTHAAFSSTTHAIGSFWGNLPDGHPANLLVVQFYLLGIAAAVYHLANGAATGAEVLGLTPTVSAQRRLWNACVVAGIGLMLVGMSAWYSFALRK